MMSTCVCNRLWCWAQMWEGEIVRLKPNLLLILASVHGRRAGAECDERTQFNSGGWKCVTWNWSGGWITKTPMNGDLTTWLNFANEPKLGRLEGNPGRVPLGWVVVAFQAEKENASQHRRMS